MNVFKNELLPVFLVHNHADIFHLVIRRRFREHDSTLVLLARFDLIGGTVEDVQNLCDTVVGDAWSTIGLCQTGRNQHFATGGYLFVYF